MSVICPSVQLFGLPSRAHAQSCQAHQLDHDIFLRVSGIRNSICQGSQHLFLGSMRCLYGCTPSLRPFDEQLLADLRASDFSHCFLAVCWPGAQPHQYMSACTSDGVRTARHFQETSELNNIIGFLATTAFSLIVWHWPRQPSPHMG